MRWYVQPGNFSATGCLTEVMSTAGGPTRRLAAHAANKDKKQKDYYDVMSPVRNLMLVESV